MERTLAIHRGKQLQYATLLYNATEAAVSLSAGALASSVSLVSFGVDSLIELLASLAALFLLHNKASEKTAQRLIACSFVLLALGTAFEALTRVESAQRSKAGLIIAIASVVVMPLLSRQKKNVAAALNSSALSSEARQTDFCFYLSVVLLVGVLAQWLFNAEWVDSAAALAMTPLILLEARRSWLGQSCAGGCECHL